MAEFKKPAPRRTFADALHKKGEAANIREVVSKAVRENAIQVSSTTGLPSKRILR